MPDCFDDFSASVSEYSARVRTTFPPSVWPVCTAKKAAQYSLSFDSVVAQRGTRCEKKVKSVKSVFFPSSQECKVLTL